MKKQKTFNATEQRLLKKLADQRNFAQTRFPLLFGLLITFGFIATLNGFERLMERTWFYDNPVATFIIGLTTLVLTGAAYRKLN